MLNEKEIKALDLIAEDITYQNYFFKKAKDLKWFYPLKETGYFSFDGTITICGRTEKDTYPKAWNVLPYLEFVSQQLNLPGNEGYVDELLLIIKNVSAQSEKATQHIDLIYTWWRFVKILSNIPNNKIENNIIALLKKWLKTNHKGLLGPDVGRSLLPKFLNSNDPDDYAKAENIVEIITDIKWVQPYGTDEEEVEKRKEPKTVVDSYWLLKSFKQNAAKVGERCSEKIIFTIADRLKEILRKKHEDTFEDYSYIWFQSLYDKPSTGEKETNRALTTILRDILLEKAKKNPEQTEVILKKYLSDDYKYPLFRRIVLFIVGNEYKTNKTIFIDMIGDDESGRELFNSPDYSPELSELLKHNCLQFGENEKNLIKDIIEKGPLGGPDEEKSDKRITYWKQKWYVLLKEIPEFNELYEQQRAILDVPEKEIRYKTGFISSWGPGPSPIVKEDILKLTSKDLAQKLKEFRSGNELRGDPTTGGFAEELKEAVKINPQKFTTDDLKPFMDVGFIYVYEILSGIKDVWNGKKVIDWGKVFQFVKSYIDRRDFWDDAFVVEPGSWLGGATHDWIVGIVAELIEDGARDDDWAFDEKYFEDAREIIFLLLDKVQPDEKEVEHDFVTHAINSSLGKTLMALILLALRIARVNDKKGIKTEEKWNNEFKTRHEKLLNDQIVDAYTLTGRYLPNLYYLDARWVGQRIETLAVKKGSTCWQAFMDGYLSVGRVYDKLYALMRELNHYEFSIEHGFKEEHNNERLIQEITFEYLRGQESITKGLFKKILTAWEFDQIREMLSFLWAQREHLRKDTPEIGLVKERIMDVWLWIYKNKYQTKPELEFTKEDRLILSQLAMLTTYLSKIEKKYFELLKVSAPFVNEDYNAHFFIEYLDDFDDKQSIEYAGELYLKMLEGCIPDYDKKNILSIVEKLYKNDRKDTADKICNTYGMRGNHMLRDLYEKYNKKNEVSGNS